MGALRGARRSIRYDPRLPPAEGATHMPCVAWGSSDCTAIIYDNHPMSSSGIAFPIGNKNAFPIGNIKRNLTQSKAEEAEYVIAH